MSIIVESDAENVNEALLLYNNVFEEGTITSTPGTDHENAIEDTTFDYWITGPPNSKLKVSLGAGYTCDCVGVAAHTMGTDGASFRVQHSSDGMSWTGATSLISPLTDETIMVKFKPVTADYWRFMITTADTTIGVVKLGEALKMPNGVLSGHTAINHANRIKLLTNNSVGGHFLGSRVKSIGGETDINFGLIETSYLENDMAMFESHFNNGRAFFYAGAPDSFPDDCGYCWRNGDEMRPSYEEGGTLANISLSVAVYDG